MSTEFWLKQREFEACENEYNAQTSENKAKFNEQIIVLRDAYLEKQDQLNKKFDLKKKEFLILENQYRAYLLSIFPTDLWSTIATYLDVKSILCLATVNKYMYRQVVFTYNPQYSYRLLWSHVSMKSNDLLQCVEHNNMNLLNQLILRKVPADRFRITEIFRILRTNVKLFCLLTRAHQFRCDLVTIKVRTRPKSIRTIGRRISLLSEACEMKSFRAVESLLEAKADPNTTYKKLSMVEYAISIKCPLKIINVLLKHGATIAKRTFYVYPKIGLKRYTPKELENLHGLLTKYQPKILHKSK